MGPSVLWNIFTIFTIITVLLHHKSTTYLVASLWHFRKYRCLEKIIICRNYPRRLLVSYIWIIFKIKYQSMSFWIHCKTAYSVYKQHFLLISHSCFTWQYYLFIIIHLNTFNLKPFLECVTALGLVTLCLCFWFKLFSLNNCFLFVLYLVSGLLFCFCVSPVILLSSR